MATREELQQVRYAQFSQVITQPGSPSPQEKVHTCEILDVQRGVAVVRWGRIERKIRLNELRLLPEDEVRLARERERKRPSKEEEGEVKEPVSEVAGPRSPTELDAWLEMGKETVLGPLRARLAELSDHRVDLETLAANVQKELEAATKESATLERQLQVLTESMKAMERARVSVTARG
jgi:hypothetical protein